MATTTPTNISFDEIEAVAVVGVGPGVDATFWGTSGDDDITVQATSATAFTVAMGGTVPVSYSGLASFTVNGKEGDDDITVAPITPGGVATDGADHRHRRFAHGGHRRSTARRGLLGG